MLPVAAEFVILCSFLRVAQHFVRFVYFLEFFIRILIIWVQIRVVFPGKLAISLLNFLVACSFIEPENLIIVYIVHPVFFVWLQTFFVHESFLRRSVQPSSFGPLYTAYIWC